MTVSLGVWSSGNGRPPSSPFSSAAGGTFSWAGVAAARRIGIALETKSGMRQENETEDKVNKRDRYVVLIVRAQQR